MFRTSQIRPGWVPPVPRGRWCPPGRLTVTDRHPPLPSGQSLHPAGIFRLAGPTLTRHQTEVHSRSPVRSSPCLWLPDGTGTLGRFSELHTPPLPATHVGAGTGQSDTDPKRTYDPTAAPPSRCIYCAGATSRRTRNCVLATAPNRGGDPRQLTSEFSLGAALRRGPGKWPCSAVVRVVGTSTFVLFALVRDTLPVRSGQPRGVCGAGEPVSEFGGGGHSQLSAGTVDCCQRARASESCSIRPPWNARPPIFHPGDIGRRNEGSGA